MCSTAEPIQRTSLPFADHLLLCTIRAWVVGVHRRRSVSQQLQEAFGRIGVAEAAEDLDRFMTALAAGASRQIQVDCVCNPTISADERMLLDVVALHQAHRSFEAMVLLRTMMVAGEALAANDDAARLARRLGAAGCRVACREQPTDRLAFSIRPTHAGASTAIH